jgi:tRNA nucleotidyltransferase (CCA-adding enzyme)
MSLSTLAPDLEKSYGVEQGGIHKYDVWEHLLRSVQHATDKDWPLDVRLAALFHDVGKPSTRREGEEKWTFYGHEVVGAKIAKKVLTDLKFPVKLVEKVVKLIRWHMFFSDTETITHSAVRRLIANVGKENVWDLMNVRAADRIGTGRPKESPYRLRKYHAMIEEVMSDPVSVGMLKIDGAKVMEVTEMKPGPKVGYILHALLEEVIEDPKKNNLEYLEKRAQELSKLSEKELKTLGEQGKVVKQQEEEKKIGEIRKKHWVE